MENQALSDKKIFKDYIWKGIEPDLLSFQPWSKNATTRVVWKFPVEDQVSNSKLSWVIQQIFKSKVDAWEEMKPNLLDFQP